MTGSDDAIVRYFLIADVRGYTRFTQTHGDEAAAGLAARFAAVTREVVTADQGVLLELRGDEALVVFSSARRAIRAAVALQDRFVDQTLADPSVPLTVGIGLDAGEAVEVEGGYRGGALNLAARLCGAARPGQVLASAEIVHLARVVTGVRYRSRGQLRFKGLAEPVTVMEVLSEAEDPARGRRFAEVVRAGRSRAPRKRRRLLVAAAAVFAVAVATGVVALVAPGGTSLAVAADSVAVVDAKDLKVVDSVPVGTRPDGIAVGYGSVWAVNEAAGSVSRLDAAARRSVQTVAVGRSPRGIASGPTGVWVANSADRSVSWINPHTNAVVKTIPVGNAPTGVAIGRGKVWVTDSLDDTVSVIDPATGRVSTTIPVGRRPTGIAVGPADVWVTNSGDATVSRINISTRVVTDTLAVGAGADGVAVGAGGVWVTNTLDDTVTHISASADRAVGTFPAGKGPGGIAVTSRGVWVTSEYGGTLSRIDPARDQVVRSLALGGGPRGVVALGDALWVTAAGSPAAHRGGTLRVLLGDGEIQTIDPQADYTFFDSIASTETNDGLVTFRRVGGPDGGTLVPDLATALPTPTDGGRTYTFHVRTGIRYSTGVPVRPTDVRRGLERTFKIPGIYAAVVRSYYSGIVGADDCIKAPKDCQLSRGVAADDTAGTVTIHLVRADGDFLDKLALPVAAAVPPGTPDHDVGTHPVPATGPYRIASFAPNEHLILVRNPMFREWSHAAQPAGYPDRITIGFGDFDAAVNEVEQGRADFTYGFEDRLNEVATQHPDLLHTDNTAFVLYALMNTTAPPFNDRRVRQAIAYAVDRSKVVNLWGGKHVAAPSCQMLPPTFPGYQPYCPFTQHPSADGTWHAPDLARARRLVHESGTTNDRITVTSDNDLLGPYLVRLIQQLGYRKPKVVSANPFGPPPKGATFQIGFESYAADYPSPSGVLTPLVGCSGPLNVSKVCDHRLDAAVEAARQLQVTDPAAAAVAWKRVERTTLAEMPYAPVISILRDSVTSQRLGNYQRSAALGPLFDQMWVKR